MFRTSRGERRWARCAALVVTPLVVAVAAAGCASSEDLGGDEAETVGGVTLPAELIEAARERAVEIMGDTELSGSIEFIGTESGAEGAIFEAAYAPFTEGTGVAINYSASQDSNNIIQSRVNAGNLPDVVVTSIAMMHEYASKEPVLNLSEVIGDDVLASNYTSSLLSTLTVDGGVRGVVQGMNNFPFWYNPEQYTGPEEGASWQEVQEWSDALAAEGQPAWCIAQEAGADSGFPGLQFIEVLFLKKYGPELYLQWGEGDLPYTSAEVRDAFEMFGAFATQDDQVSGGVQGALSTGIGEGSNGLISEPAECQAVIWGTWVSGLIDSSVGGVEPGENLDFMLTPASTPEYAKTEFFSAQPAIAFSDSDETKAFMTYLASTEFQTLLASANQWTVSNKNVSSDTYSNVVLKKAAELYASDDITLAIGPNVLEPNSLHSEARKGVVEYMANPDRLDEILERIEKVNQER